MSNETDQNTEPEGPFYTWRVRLHARDWVASRLAEHLGEYTVAVEPERTTLLSGELPDLSAAYGLVMTLRACSLQPLSLHIDRHEHEGETR